MATVTTLAPLPLTPSRRQRTQGSSSTDSTLRKPRKLSRAQRAEAAGVTPGLGLSFNRIASSFAFALGPRSSDDEADRPASSSGRPRRATRGGVDIAFVPPSLSSASLSAPSLHLASDPLADSFHAPPATGLLPAGISPLKRPKGKGKEREAVPTASTTVYPPSPEHSDEQPEGSSDSGHGSRIRAIDIDAVTPPSAGIPLPTPDVSPAFEPSPPASPKSSQGAPPRPPSPRTSSLAWRPSSPAAQDAPPAPRNAPISPRATPPSPQRPLPAIPSLSTTKSSPTLQHARSVRCASTSKPQLRHEDSGQDLTDPERTPRAARRTRGPHVPRRGSFLNDQREPSTDGGIPISSPLAQYRRRPGTTSLLPSSLPSASSFPFPVDAGSDSPRRPSPPRPQRDPRRLMSTSSPANDQLAAIDTLPEGSRGLSPLTPLRRHSSTASTTPSPPRAHPNIRVQTRSGLPYGGGPRLPSVQLRRASASPSSDGRAPFPRTASDGSAQFRASASSTSLPPSPNLPETTSTSSKSNGVHAPLPPSGLGRSNSALPAPAFYRHTRLNSVPSMPLESLPDREAQRAAALQALTGGSGFVSDAGTVLTAGSSLTRDSSLSAMRKTLTLEDPDMGESVSYQLGNPIGRGQFGTVYRALNLRTGQTVAVKRIRLDGLSEAEVTNMSREVETLKRLSHPGVVKYEGLVREEPRPGNRGALNIILEFAENGSLHSSLKSFGSFPESLVATYVLKILEGLIYLHDCDVVHCDLKAANILTTKTGNVKLSDFGVSLNMRNMEGQGEVAGTPNWMAPEVIELKGPTPASDIWSLACTIIELLTGRPPYGDMHNGLSVMFRIVEDGCPPIPEKCSPLLHSFLELCFQKDPLLRPTARDLAEHDWLKENWSAVRDLRAQDSVPFLRRISQSARTEASAVFAQQTPVFPHASTLAMSTEDLRRVPSAVSVMPATAMSFTEAVNGMVSPTSAESAGGHTEDLTPRESLDPEHEVWRPHSFMKSTFSKTIICRLCQMPIKKSAVLCEECGLICHAHCAKEINTSCDMRLMYAQRTGWRSSTDVSLANGAGLSPRPPFSVPSTPPVATTPLPAEDSPLVAVAKAFSPKLWKRASQSSAAISQHHPTSSVFPTAQPPPSQPPTPAIAPMLPRAKRVVSMPAQPRNGQLRPGSRQPSETSESTTSHSACACGDPLHPAPPTPTGPSTPATPARPPAMSVDFPCSATHEPEGSGVTAPVSGGSSSLGVRNKVRRLRRGSSAKDKSDKDCVIM